MSENQMLFLTSMVCFIVVIIGAIIKRPMGLIKYAIRGIVGVVVIELVNMYVSTNMVVGINELTVGVSTLLGLPGVALLYGIRLYGHFMAG